MRANYAVSTPINVFTRIFDVLFLNMTPIVVVSLPLLGIVTALGMVDFLVMRLRNASSGTGTQVSIAEQVRIWSYLEGSTEPGWTHLEAHFPSGFSAGELAAFAMRRHPCLVSYNAHESTFLQHCLSI